MKETLELKNGMLPSVWFTPRSVSPLTTGAEVVTLSGGFTVTQAVNQAPVVSAGANQTIYLGYYPVAYTEYPLSAGSSPREITIGPDGNLWFTETGGNRIGRITPAGTITEFPVPSTSGFGVAAVQGIVAGPDGNLWFAEYLASKIGKITTAESLQNFPSPAEARSGLLASPLDPTAIYGSQSAGDHPGRPVRPTSGE